MQNLRRRRTTRGSTYIEVLLLIGLVLTAGFIALQLTDRGSFVAADKEVACLDDNGGCHLGDPGSSGGPGGSGGGDSKLPSTCPAHGSGAGYWTGRTLVGILDGAWQTVKGLGELAWYLSPPGLAYTGITGKPNPGLEAVKQLVILALSATPPGRAIAEATGKDPLADTAGAIWNAVVQSWKCDPAYTLGRGIFEAATVVGPAAWTKIKAAREAAEAAKIAAAAREAEETAAAIAKARELEEAAAAAKLRAAEDAAKAAKARELEEAARRSRSVWEGEMGAAGRTAEELEQMAAKVKAMKIDRDAVAMARQHQGETAANYSYHRDTYKRLDDYLAGKGPLDPEDAEFVRHEVLEHMLENGPVGHTGPNGIPYREAHQKTIDLLGETPEKLHNPKDVEAYQITFTDDGKMRIGRPGGAPKP
jgi:hypothetical protein